MSVDRAINLLAAVTLIQMMVTIGLGATIPQVIAVARDPRLLLRAALGNYLLVPAAAVTLLLLFRAQPMVAAGFLIAAVCPGAPFGPPFTALARGNVAAAVGLMVILAASSAVMAPLLLYFMLPLVSGDQAAQVNVGKLIGTLFGAQLIPLGIGLAVRRVRPLLADRLKGPFGKLSTILNLVTFGAIIAAQFHVLREIRPSAYAGMLVLVLLSIAAGWGTGVTGPGNRAAMVMATAVRNVGVAMVIATGSFAGTAAVTAATAFGVFQTVLMAAAALVWGRIALTTDHVLVEVRA
jgi:BASS family bile acid:Na+ symporter